MNVGQLGRFIRDQRRTASLSLRNLSKLTGISNPYLSQIERGLRRPSADILQAIAKALRISAETLYVKAGILDERRDQVDPITEIRRDSSITPKQKQILVDLYRSFREAGRPANSNRDRSRSTPSASARPKTGGARARTGAGPRTKVGTRASRR